MTRINRNMKQSLPTNTSEENYFFLKNSDYYSSKDRTYICLEDKGFGIGNYIITICFTNIYPGGSYEEALNSCHFSLKNAYAFKSSAISKKYYYYFQTSIDDYTIFNYKGSNSSGNLYVHSDYIDLFKTTMTPVSRNKKTSLPITPYENTKYFFLTNRDYYSRSSYIYIFFEDNNSALDYTSIGFCYSETKPDFYPEKVINSCFFNSSSNYNKQTSSKKTKYYYKIPSTSIKYTIVSYDGPYSSGSLYVTCDYNDLSVKVSTVTIVFITIGTIIFLAIVIIIIVCYFKRCRKSKIKIIPITESDYVIDNHIKYPLIKPEIPHAPVEYPSSEPTPVDYPSAEPAPVAYPY